MRLNGLLGFALLLFSLSSSASIVFTDSFDQNSLGLNLTPTGWAVAGGNVDIIGAPNFYDLLPGHGRYIDLDGSSSAPGTLQRSFSLLAGYEYTVSFDLAGNQRYLLPDTVSVVFGTTSQNYSLTTYELFSTYTLTFTPHSSGQYVLSFKNSGNDQMGALLDNVQISEMHVPEPATAALLFGVVLVLGCMKRRSAAYSKEIKSL